MAGFRGVAHVLLLLFCCWAGAVTGYRQLNQCDICSADAASVCNSMSPAEQESAAQRLVNACGSLTPETCCSLRSSASWSQVSACPCAGVGSSAVSLSSIDAICGCGTDASRMSDTLPPLPAIN